MTTLRPARTSRTSLRQIALLSGWNISPRGETSWNIKRRCRQKDSRLPKDPGSLPKHCTASKSANWLTLALFRPGPEKQDFGLSTWTSPLSLFICTEKSSIKTPCVLAAPSDRMSDRFENCFQLPFSEIHGINSCQPSQLVWDVWSTVCESSFLSQWNFTCIIHVILSQWTNFTIVTCEIYKVGNTDHGSPVHARTHTGSVLTLKLTLSKRNFLSLCLIKV